MSLFSTTLSKAMTADDRIMHVSSGTGIEVGMHMRVGSEQLTVQRNEASPFLVVLRGQRGTPSTSHGIGDTVIVGRSSDFGATPRPSLYSDGAGDALPVVPGVLTLSGEARSLSLATPSIDLDGLTLQVVSVTDETYTLTTPNDFNGGDYVSVDFAAVGDTLSLCAIGGSWVVTNAVNVTLNEPET